MNPTNTLSQPVALAIIADSFGCSRDDTALLAASIASGLAGARAGLRSGLGTTSVGSSMVSASADPSWFRLLKHLLDPVNILQTHLRNFCRSIPPECLDVRSTEERMSLRTEPTIAESEPDPFLAIPIAYQRLQAARHPTILLNYPDSKAYERGMKECADRAPFVVTGFPTAALATTLARDCAGADRIFEGAQGSVETVHTQLLLCCEPDQLRAEFRARNPLLQHALIITPEPGESRNHALNSRQQATRRYCTGIRESMNARYCGSGVIFNVADNAAAYLDDSANKIDSWVRGLAPEIRPYLRDASSLPLRLLWAYKLFAMQNDVDLHVSAVATANTILRKSAALLESLTRAGYDDEEVVMLGKLNEKPLPFRGLARRYTHQQRSIHEPVLGRLLKKGYVRETGALLHVTDPGREYLNRVTCR